VNASEVVHAIQHYCPEAKDSSWEEHRGMGYFKTTLHGSRRVITVDLSGWNYMLGVAIPGDENSFGEVLAEIIRGLQS